MSDCDGDAPTCSPVKFWMNVRLVELIIATYNKQKECQIRYTVTNTAPGFVLVALREQTWPSSLTNRLTKNAGKKSETA